MVRCEENCLQSYWSAQVSRRQMLINTSWVSSSKTSYPNASQPPKNLYSLLSSAENKNFPPNGVASPQVLRFIDLKAGLGSFSLNHGGSKQSFFPLIVWLASPSPWLPTKQLLTPLRIEIEVCGHLCLLLFA